MTQFTTIIVFLVESVKFPSKNQRIKKEDNIDFDDAIEIICYGFCIKIFSFKNVWDEIEEEEEIDDDEKGKKEIKKMKKIFKKKKLKKMKRIRMMNKNLI